MLLIFSVLAGIAGCKKSDDSGPVIANTEVTFGFKVDNNSLLFDSINYFNAAGNNYSVSRLTFYVSAFEFEYGDGTIYKSDKVFLVDGKSNANTVLSFADLPSGTYKHLKFLVGLDSLHNIENGLPNTMENENMVWPTTMGGGYHFLKLEGNFKDQANTFGYAMHLGLNRNCVMINLTNSFKLQAPTGKLNLAMNINEWFVNPYIYDFNTDGNYSMTDSAAMAKLSKNGSDVFTLN